MARRVARIALVEDKPGAQKSFADALEGDPGLRLASIHATAEAALREMVLAKVDLAVVDIVLPRMGGIELIRELKQRKAGLSILMLTAFSDAEKIFAAMASGADGYVLKSASPQDWRTAIHQVLAGGSSLTPSVARKIIQHFRKSESQSPEFAKLTPRELAVLREVATGRTYGEVGDVLGITAETVRVHIRNIKEKLHASTRGEIVARFLRT